MFLVAITRLPVRHLLKDFNAEQFELLSSQVLTLVTDHFLSKLIIEPQTFSVIESPSVGSPHPGQVIFSEVTIDGSGNSIDIFRSTISGRPIYYHINSAGELFCSTHISMLRKMGLPIEENKDALPELFVYRYTIPPQTLFKNIKQVDTGSHVRVNHRKGQYEIVKVDRYDPPIPENGKANNTIHNVADRTLSILNDSTHVLDRGNDRIALLLSGGLDSSILFKICQSNFYIDSTFSTGWPVPDAELNIERTYAYSAAEAFGAKHFYYEPTIEEYLYGFLEAIAAAEEPLHHLQSVLIYLLLKNGLPKSKNVVVSGEGADGIFGPSLNNYLFYSEKGIRRIMLLWPFFHLVESAGRVSEKAKYLASTLKKIGKKDLPLSHPDNLIWSLGAYGSSDWVSRYFKVRNEDIIKGRYDSIQPFEGRSLYDIISLLAFFGSGSVTRALWSKLGEEQRKVLCYPYTSAEMLNYIYSIPWDVKLKNPKNVLRHVATQLKIPESIVHRPKSGLGIDPEHWFRGGWLEPLIPLSSKVFPGDEICSLQSTDLANANTLWNILNYSLWKRLIINNEPPADLFDELTESISKRPSALS